MNVDEALRQLGADGDFPREAMEWALAHWDEASPRFIAKLRAAASRGDVSEQAANEMFFIVHLCGDKGETRAYEPLCRLVAQDHAIAEWLGDGVEATLPGIFIKTFDGDAQPLMNAIVSARGDEYARASGLAALAYLAQTAGVPAPNEMRAFFRKLPSEPGIVEGVVFWDVWAGLAAHLGYGELRVEVGRLNRIGRLDPHAFDVEAFDAVLARVRKNPQDREELEGLSAKPFENAVETLATWGADDDENNAYGTDSDPGLEGPRVNPYRDVGRNDPCPCGSGKKFKKCCLAT
jgi:uncharacterized protein